jgi:hypothetical protein
MANTIILNCLVISNNDPPESISYQSIITLKISTDETVDQLRPMIKERWPLLFENILPTHFILYKTTGVVTSIPRHIQQYKNGITQACEETFPYEHFPEQPPNEKIQIVVYV